MNIEEALNSFRDGKFVLLHDGKDRENEVDLIIAAQYIKPEHIAIMRKEAGGLICIAMDYDIASSLGLKYMHDILKNEFDGLVYNNTPYGEKPSFSITINHINTYTGVTDKDRALTISMLSKICSLPNSNKRELFFANFKTPGHVHLLIARKGLLNERNGHTELAITLAKMAGVLPLVVICEMLDDKTNEALSLEKAIIYAKNNNLAIIEGRDIKEAFRLSNYDYKIGYSS